MNGVLPIRRALISVADKAGLLPLARALSAAGAEIVSTGGTAAAIEAAGGAVIEAADYGGFPEILDGRVKTLVPRIHGGILARRDLPAHQDAMARHDIPPIDLVAVNLYPFEATVARGAAPDAAIEMIDIGGPALIRGAAKNHDAVAVLTDPAQYAELIAALGAGGTTLAFRRRLAAAAFAHTAAYDAAIAGWFAAGQDERFPERLVLAGSRRALLRYGENPHQAAALYATGAGIGIAAAEQVQGKALSYNNIADADAALACAAEFDAPAAVIVKHANPCGAAVADTLAEAWRLALRGDPVSAFGGIVAVNRTLDAAAAAAVGSIFTEVIVAPDADPAALALLADKPNLRLLLTGGMPPRAPAGIVYRSIAGGLLAQAPDAGGVPDGALRVVTRRPPTPRELADLHFAFLVCKHVKSNAIVFARDGATTGIGAGQMSRVDAVRIAAWKGAEAAIAAGLEAPLTTGSVVASDAFFPFADGLQAAIAAGATAAIQPGGSRRDAEVIAAADAAGIAMVFAGMRHFRH